MDEGNSFRMTNKKFLLVRFSAMGDIVLSSPIARILSVQSGVEIHVLTKEMYTELWTANPYVSKIYTIKKDLKEVITDLKRKIIQLLLIYMPIYALCFCVFIFGIFPFIVLKRALY